MVEELTVSKNGSLEELKAILLNFEQVECPLNHVFLAGVYVRQIFMPATTTNSKGEEVQTVIVSKRHKTEHPFVVTEGKVAVYNKADEFRGIIEAPYVDITPAGTFRALHILEDCRWLTIHRLPYITGKENGWSKGKKAALLKRIENDLVENEETENIQ